MKMHLAIASLAALLLSAQAGAINFTPSFEETIEDGVPMRRTFFCDGPRRNYYRPPGNSSRTGDARSATFRKADSESRIIIENGAEEHAQIPFDEPGLEALRKLGRAALPPHVTEATNLWETVNPVIIHGWTSFEVGFDYVQSGRRFCRSVLFINLDAKRQIRFIVDAVPAEFAPHYKSAYRSLATWWEPSASELQR